jgi:hypothetical protein
MKLTTDQQQQQPDQQQPDQQQPDQQQPDVNFINILSRIQVQVNFSKTPYGPDLKQINLKRLINLNIQF